jgi:hypothetical protein
MEAFDSTLCVHMMQFHQIRAQDSAHMILYIRAVAHSLLNSQRLKFELLCVISHTDKSIQTVNGILWQQFVRAHCAIPPNMSLGQCPDAILYKSCPPKAFLVIRTYVWAVVCYLTHSKSIQCVNGSLSQQFVRPQYAISPSMSLGQCPYDILYKSCAPKPSLVTRTLSLSYSVLPHTQEIHPTCQWKPSTALCACTLCNFTKYEPRTVPIWYSI